MSKEDKKLKIMQVLFTRKDGSKGSDILVTDLMIGNHLAKLMLDQLDEFENVYISEIAHCRMLEADEIKEFGSAERLKEENNDEI